MELFPVARIPESKDVCNRKLLLGKDRSDSFLQVREGNPKGIAQLLKKSLSWKLNGTLEFGFREPERACHLFG